jgi:predicted MFS family arabinose efflux permease
VLVQVPGGSGGDRWGRRPFFAMAMVLLALSQVGRWLASGAAGPAILLVAQILGGAAQGVATVNAWALVADAGEAGRGRQGQSFGILNASLAVGLVAGYIVAGGLGSLIGWRSMSLVLGALPLVVLPTLVWIPRRSPQSATVRPGLGIVLRAVLDRQRLALTVMAALVLGAGQGATYLLPFGAQQRDLGPFAAALLLVPYVVGSVIAGPLGGRLSDQRGTRPVMLGLLVIGILACVALVWGAGSSPVLVACFLLIGASVNGALPLLAVRVLAMHDARGVGAGTILAGLRMGQSSGTFIGPGLAGLVLTHAGLNAGWLAQAACLLASLVLYERVTTQTR